MLATGYGLGNVTCITSILQYYCSQSTSCSASPYACEAFLQQCRKYLHNTYTKLEPKPKIILVHDIFISVIKAKIKFTTP